jgi:hypothetical protein
MDYYNYQQGLIVHHLNEEGTWNTHLRNCRNFILKSLDFYKPSVVTVLGSGWLLDLPLNEMNDLVSKVILVDIVHPPEVKSQVATLKGVFLREEDVTGGLIKQVWEKASGRTFFNKLRSIKEIKVAEYQPSFESGLIISLNILTQLESLLLEFLRKRTKADNESFLQFRKEIQTSHISFLKKNNSVLITDISEIITERNGQIIEKPSVLTDLPDSKFREEWTWDFESRNPDYYNKRSVFNVLALVL